MTTKEILSQRQRGMDRAAEQLADIRRIREAGRLLVNGRGLTTEQKDWLAAFCLMVESHPVDERSQLKLTPEQRATIDQLTNHAK